MSTTTTTPPIPTPAQPLATFPHRTYRIRGAKRSLLTLGQGPDCKLLDVPDVLYKLARQGTDVPGSYLVETGLDPTENAGELEALLDDYVAQAKRHQEVPMRCFALTVALQAHAA